MIAMSPQEKFVAEVRAILKNSIPGAGGEDDEKVACISDALDAYDKSGFGVQCTRPGFCSIHGTGNPHDVNGQQYVE